MCIVYMSACPKLPVIAGDPVTVVTMCYDCDNLYNREQYGKPHPYHNYIHHTHGHNPSCSSKHSAYWSDPLLLSYLSLTFVPVNISFSSNTTMHLLSAVPCRVSYKSTTCVHAHMN